LASLMAARREPAPLSFRLVTVNVVMPTAPNATTSPMMLREGN
jgi:hypothetical protein